MADLREYWAIDDEGINRLFYRVEDVAAQLDALQTERDTAYWGEAEGLLREHSLEAQLAAKDAALLALRSQNEQLRDAAEHADWQQVVLNGGPPCFHLIDGKFCLRAERWVGHGPDHSFVSLAAALAASAPSPTTETP